jgi:hypothetical protein
LSYAAGVVSANPASTSVQGVVQLSDSTNDTSITKAATTKALKTTFDLATTASSSASTKVAKAGDTMTGLLTVTAPTLANGIYVSGNVAATGKLAFDNVTAASAPGASTSSGERIRLWPGDATTVSYGFGMETGALWSSMPAGKAFKWYNGTTPIMQLNATALTVTGDITAFGSLSDLNLKESIVSIEPSQAMDIVSQVRPVTFTWNQQTPNSARRGTHDQGFIAQQLAQVYPYVTEIATLPDGHEYAIVRYEKLTPLLCASIQHLKEEVSRLSKRLHALEHSISPRDGEQSMQTAASPICQTDIV